MLRKLFAVGIGATGTIYVLQGTGIYTPLPSFMYTDTRWAVVGIVLILVGLLFWPRKAVSK